VFSQVPQTVELHDKHVPSDKYSPSTHSIQDPVLSHLLQSELQLLIQELELLEHVAHT